MLNRRCPACGPSVLHPSSLGGSADRRIGPCGPPRRAPDRHIVTRLTIGFDGPHSDIGGDETQPPERFSLFQNYPNPFNPPTTIRFDMPVPGEVSISIYNISGQLVSDLFSGFQAAGTHNLVWDGKDGHGIMMSSGMYFYRLKTAGFVQTKRMLLLK